jgi:hypothetical protein
MLLPLKGGAFSEEQDMRKIFYVLISMAMMFAVGSVSAASIEDDITSQGQVSYLHKYIAAKKLASMVRDYEIVTATNTILYSECGTTYYLNSATEFASTLPSPVVGCQFTFVIKAAPVGANYTVVTASNATVIFGSVTVNGAVIAGANEDTITFTASAALAGDWVTVESDGTNWYVRGQGAPATAITLTDAA